jgi:hypothetical protein
VSCGAPLARICRLSVPQPVPSLTEDRRIVWKRRTGVSTLHPV